MFVKLISAAARKSATLQMHWSACIISLSHLCHSTSVAFVAMDYKWLSRRRKTVLSVLTEQIYPFNDCDFSLDFICPSIEAPVWAHMEQRKFFLISETQSKLHTQIQLAVPYRPHWGESNDTEPLKIGFITENRNYANVMLKQRFLKSVKAS